MPMTQATWVVLRRDREALVLFCNYFFQFASLGVLLPFFALYLQDKGFSGTEVAFIFLCFPLVQILSNPIYGYLADHFISPLYIYRFALCATLTCAPLFYLLDGFWPLVVLSAVYAIFRMPNIALLNTAALEKVAHTDISYGQLRVGGSYGFITFALVGGLWTQYMGIERLPDVLLVAVLLHLLLGWGAPLRQSLSPGQVRPQRWYRFLLRWNWAIFLLGVVLSRIGEAAYNVFYGVHIRELGYDTRYVGLAWAVAVASEVFVMLYSARLVARRSTAELLMGLYTLGMLRWFAISQVSALPILMGLQLTHGFTFGLFYIVAVKWAHDHSPSGLETTAQAVLGAAMFGVAGVIGQTVAGYIYDLYDSATVFLVAAGFGLSSVIVACLLYLRDRAAAE